MNPAIEGYYRLHAKIYDLTRWTFLFGRTDLIDLARARLSVTPPARILEVGCGTGVNLAALGRAFPNARLFGVDLSGAMLDKAASRLEALGMDRRATLLRQAYAAPIEPGTFDLAICSYSLTMFNPGWDTALDAIRQDLRPGGKLGLVDFHASRHRWFRNWMAVNHVRMEGHLRPALEVRFEPEVEVIRPAYASLWPGGIWDTLLFFGGARR